MEDKWELIEVLVLMQEDLTLSMLKNCKQSQPVIKAIMESTTDDEGMLFAALYFHDELEQVISKYEQLEAAQKTLTPLTVRPWKLLKSLEENCLGILMPVRVSYKLLKALEEISQKSHASEAKSPALVGTHNENKLVDFPKGEY